MNLASAESVIGWLVTLGSGWVCLLTSPFVIRVGEVWHIGFIFFLMKKQRTVYITCVQFHNKMNTCVRLKKQKKNMTKTLSPIWSSPPPFPPEGKRLNFLSVIPLLCFMVSPYESLTVNNIMFTFSLFWPSYNCNHIECIFLRLTLFLIMFLRFICFETWIVFHSFLDIHFCELYGIPLYEHMSLIFQLLMVLWVISCCCLFVLFCFLLWVILYCTWVEFL